MNHSTIEYSETEDDIYANDSAYEEAQIDLIKHADENDCFNFVADLNDVEQDKELVTMSGGKLTIKTVYLNTMGFVWDLYEKRDEWEEIDADHEAYNGLGGNHKGDHLYELVKKKAENTLTD